VVSPTTWPGMLLQCSLHRDSPEGALEVSCTPLARTWNTMVAKGGHQGVEEMSGT